MKDPPQHPRPDDALKAIASPVRRKILAALSSPEQNFPGQEHPYAWGVCAGKIEAGCDLSQSTVSAHLAQLHQAGLLTAKKSGQWIFYKRDEAAITGLLAWLTRELQT
ncbi:helix-turn-helix transcriptional regulator [Acidocella sp.]|uniref:ArsR/SmtB family transcription factor n=1 Tax=Acidocella sp. TaxID=50710 RepID=UPI002630A5C8|nr:metalloregulator ArsR/SmtB family transcription factor [Acidocella sp.]